MVKVKVYRFRTYDTAKDDWFVSSRMATREKIESSKVLDIVPNSETEIDASELVPGEGWTERNFKPKGSN